MFAFALATLGAALLAHLALWRIRPPRSAILTLVVIFLAAPLAAFALGRLLPLPEGWGPRGLWEHVMVFTFDFFLGLTYIFFYTAVEGDSPTCRIVASVADAGPGGLGRPDLAGVLDDERLVLSRVRAMVRQGLAEEKEGLLRLTPGGRTVARLYALVEKVFGLARGG